MLPLLALGARLFLLACRLLSRDAESLISRRWFCFDASLTRLALEACYSSTRTLGISLLSWAVRLVITELFWRRGVPPEVAELGCGFFFLFAADGPITWVIGREFGGLRDALDCCRDVFPEVLPWEGSAR